MQNVLLVQTYVQKNIQNVCSYSLIIFVCDFCFVFVPLNCVTNCYIIGIKGIYFKCNETMANESMPEQVKQPNPWRKMMTTMMMMMMMIF